VAHLFRHPGAGVSNACDSATRSKIGRVWYSLRRQKCEIEQDQSGIISVAGLIYSIIQMEEYMDSSTAITLQPIGTVVKKDGEVKIELDRKYGDGLNALEGFGHVIVLWWAHKYAEYRNQVDMMIELPYATGTTAGLFATRSPVRPNPVCISTAEILRVSSDKASIMVDEIDAADGTPVIDLKPYYGTIDRVEEYNQPDWVPGDWPFWRVPIPEEDYGEES